MNKLLAFATIIEVATGLALLVVPDLGSKLLFGTVTSGTAIAVTRVLGIALLSLGVACWPNKATSRAGLVGMLAYGGLVALYLGVLGIQGDFVGPLLWPAVALHGALTVVLAVAAGRDGRRAVVK